MYECNKCNHIKIQNKTKKKCNNCHEITHTKEHNHKSYCFDGCYPYDHCHNANICNNFYVHKHSINCKGCNTYCNYYSNNPRRRHRHKTTHDFTNTHGLVSDHCFCHKYKLTGYFHSRKCCYQDLCVYYSGIIEDESTKKCVPNPKCKYYYSYY